MKNIYEDDFSADFSRDIFSHSKKSDESTQASKPSQPSAQKPVRPAKKAPPPIKKYVAPGKAAPSSNGAYPPGYPPQPYYPQPVFYQPDPSGQPYPVYYAPPQPFVPPVAYPAPAPTEYPAQTPSVPSVPSDNEAGTRVLFQSDDFDKKEDLRAEHGEYEEYEDYYGYASESEGFLSEGFDLSEITLPSAKRAPAPSKRPSASFRIDEMEIGTYEFNIMTAGQTSTSKSVLTPAEEKQRLGINEETYLDEELEEDFFTEDVPEEETAETDFAEEEKKALPTSEIIRRSVLAVAVIAMIISLACLANEYRLHKKNKDLMNDLSGLIITEASSTTEPTTKNNSGSDKKPSTTIPSTLPIVERPLSPEEQWEALKAENPDITFPENLQLKYAKLYAQNTDFVGYLYAEGSELDTPIVQGADDKEYVEKNFHGEYTKYACPFVTCHNNIENLDDNTIIFGHHMRDGSIFGTLSQYRTLEGYKKAPVISFNTIYQDYDFKVIATIITNINPKDDNDYVFTYYWTNLNNELNHTAYLNQLSQRSLYDTGVDVLPSDKLLTLSTCCKDFEDARLVVVARLVRPGESSEVDTSRAVENENPRFPQAYYDEEGKENPFANAYKWQIS